MRPLVGVSARRSQTRRLPVAIWLGVAAIVRYPYKGPNASEKPSKKRPQMTERPQLCGTTLCSFFERSDLGSEEHAFGDLTVDEIHSRREKEVREDIARRLKPVCSNFPEDEFQKLVKTMADNQVKCERRLLW